MSSTLRDISFMGAGPQLSVSLPITFESTPEFETPFLNGIGGRSFVFIPSRRVEPLEAEDDLLRDLEDRDGRVVALWRRKAPPPIWHLCWELSRGCLYTHLREEDTEKMAEPTAKSVSVVEDAETGLPSVLAYAPLEYGVSDFVGYEERIVFFDTSVGESSIAFIRPTTLEEGQQLRGSQDMFAGRQAARIGLVGEIEAQVAMNGSRADVDEVVRTLWSTFSIA